MQARFGCMLGHMRAVALTVLLGITAGTLAALALVPAPRHTDEPEITLAP